jgi:transcriptional regulator with XRE-family HTH domain
MAMPTVAQALARNLKRKRLERAVSLSELARISGVSKATLSGLERGTGNPSVDTVWALARALNSPFGELFDENDQDVVQVLRVADAQVVTSARGFIGRKLLSRRRRGGLEVYMLDLKRGAKRKSASHSPGVIEHVIVLAGRAEVGPDNEPTVAEEGDRVTFSADRPHHYHALDGPVRLLSLTDYP